MVDERLRRASVQWGLLALLVQLYVAGRWSFFAFQDLATMIHKYAATLEDRISQLKPEAFKFPLAGVYISLFALVSIVIVAALLYAGLRTALNPPPNEE